MIRLTSTQKENIAKLIKKGNSLNKISKFLNLSKTTVYYHFRKIKGKTIKLPIINFPSEKVKGEVVGIFAGDGSLCFVPNDYAYVVRIHSSICNFDYLFYVKKLFERCFGTKFRICEYKTKRFLEKRSKLIYHFFFKFLDFNPRNKSNTIKLKKNLSDEFKLGFLIGLFDTDGTITKDKEGGLRMVYFTSSKSLANQLKKTIKEFGFECNITKSKDECNQIFLYRNSIRKFAKFINSYKVNKRLKLWAGRSMEDRFLGNSNQSGNLV